jgi:hypothetical protein
MTKYKVLVLALLTAVSLTATAQYNQLGKKNEFMLKIDGGIMPFMGNLGTAGEHGYYLGDFHSGANLSVMAGVNISQDWFVGGGAGVNYFFSPKQEVSQTAIGANVFVDMDFRPIWKAVMGLDYQPTSIKFAPVFGVRAGGSLLFDDSDRYGTPFTPMVELYGGLNWYYWYHFNGMRNMTRNWHSFYATIGVAYMQQTVFLPIRLGWRW